MSTTIICLKELEERGILEYNDIVEFTVKEETLKYEVKENYLLIYGSHFNNKIFRILGINKRRIAEKTYKYELLNINSPFWNINWPESKRNDFPVLTRLVAKLYIIIEKQYPAKKHTKFTRFEIMEI